MAIEFIDGFENGTNYGNGWILSGAGIQVWNPPEARTGGNCMSVVSGQTSGQALLLLPPSAKKTVGFAYRCGTGQLGTSTQVMSILGDNGTTQHLSLTTDAAGHFQLRLGSSISTIVATSSQVYPGSIYRYVEMQATIADSGGRCTVKVDSVTWIDFTGDTRNGGTSTNIDALRLNSTTGANTGSGNWDDMYVTNTVDDTANTGRPDNGFLGDCAVVGLLPNGEGATLAWTPSTGTSHSATVDEPAPNTTDWVSASTDGMRDLWTLSDLPTNITQVFAVSPSLYAAKSDIGPCTIKTLIRDSAGTVTADAVSQPLALAYTSYQGSVRPYKPGGGAWTTTEVNALQIGVEKGSS